LVSHLKSAALGSGAAGVAGVAAGLAPLAGAAVCAFEKVMAPMVASIRISFFIFL
jgi:hypothetical protein